MSTDYNYALRVCLGASRDLSKHYGFDSPEHMEFVQRARSEFARVWGERAAVDFEEMVAVYQLAIQLLQEGSAPPELLPLSEKYSDSDVKDKEVES